MSMLRQNFDYLVELHKRKLEGEDSAGTDEYSSWIEWFCSIKSNDFFCRVDESWITERFNLYGLREEVTNYQKAIRLILDEEDDPSSWGDGSSEDVIDQSAELLYGLIHARYIMTSDGLDRMKEKYLSKDFGSCPRYYCEKSAFLPIGLTDKPGKEMVKLYCPKCKEIYETKSRYHTTDGAFFGTGFPHVFFMMFPELRPITKENFEPRLYGFKIHPSAYMLQEKAAIAHRPMPPPQYPNKK